MSKRKKPPSPEAPPSFATLEILHVEVAAETLQVLADLAEGKTFGRTVESLLWASPAFQRAAKRLGLTLPKRRGRGRVWPAKKGVSNRDS